MKKMLSLLLVLVLLTSVTCATIAEAADQNLFVSTNDTRGVPTIRTLAAVGDTLYLLSYNALFRLLPGESEPQCIIGQADDFAVSGEPIDEATAKLTDRLSVDLLFVKDGCLHGFSVATGKVIRLTDENGTPVREPVYTLQTEAITKGVEEYGYQPDTLAFCGDRLYASYFDYNRDYSDQYFMYAFELKDGAEPTLLKTGDLSSIAAYRDGKLLCTTEPIYQDDGFIPAALIIYDPLTGERQPLCDLGEEAPNTLFWDEKTDTIYYLMDAAVYALASTDAAPVLCAYLPGESYESSIARLEGGQLAITDYSGVYLRTPKTDAAETVLVVNGEFGSMQYMSVVAEHPELSIALSDLYLNNIEELSAALVSDEYGMDVLQLSPTNQPIQRVIEEGYALELDQFPQLMEIAGRMDERFLAPLRKDGKLYALPVNVQASCVSIDRDQWTETLGLSESDLPTTWMELLDFIAGYSRNYGTHQAELRLCDAWSLKDELLDIILQSEIAYQMRENGGQSFDFSNERFVSLMKKLDEIDDSALFSNGDSNENEADDPALLGSGDFDEDEIEDAALFGGGDFDEDATDEEMEEFYSRPVLLSLESGYASNPGATAAESSAFQLMLALVPGAEPVIPAMVDVLVINARTTHAQQAATYIASYAENMDATTDSIILFPDNNQPVIDPNFAYDLATLHKELQRDEKELENAAEENQAVLREELQNARERMEAFEQSGGVILSAESIAAYREQIMPYLYPVMQTPLTSFGDSSSSVRSLMEQFSRGEMDAETFVKELDSLVRLMLPKNQ